MLLWRCCAVCGRRGVALEVLIKLKESERVEKTHDVAGMDGTRWKYK